MMPLRSGDGKGFSLGWSDLGARTGCLRYVRRAGYGWSRVEACSDFARAVSYDCKRNATVTKYSFGSGGGAVLELDEVRLGWVTANLDFHLAASVN